MDTPLTKPNHFELTNNGDGKMKYLDLQFQENHIQIVCGQEIWMALDIKASVDVQELQHPKIPYKPYKKLEALEQPIRKAT